MYEGSKVILYGRYKAMKSMIAKRFALAVSEGNDWLGFRTIGGKRVMYLQLEISPPLLQQRLKAMKALPSKDVIIWTEPNIAIDTDDGMAIIEEAIERFVPDVLILDPIYKVMSGNLIENSQVKIFIDKIDKLMDEYKPLSVLLVSHARKGQYEPAWGDSDDLIGGMFFSAWADSIIKVERLGSDTLKAHFILRNAEEDIEPRVFKVTSDIDFEWQIGSI